MTGAEAISFAPVPTAARHDGWTPARQRQFIAALDVTGVVARAARADAGSFATAWDSALAMGRDRAFACAYDRAVNGHAEPRY